ncbi:Blp family class II bacteriocin [Clostridium sporogenes]|uniref:Blp family class II bacteriocin n=1 Tax=Clostridium sporogenes TaxID=1509 RepID=UPI000AF57B5E|nr:hypothetical protein [Clostridium sporogenes]MDS1008393.1 hypothetical protein [Clostridium sporogenes]SUY65086.1 Uncharacterised protein [Clostridium sporogenes]
MEQMNLMELENINGGVNWDSVGCSIAAGGPVGTVVGGIVGGAAWGLASPV